jgi:saccharopine dehydrogenase-like NADP-dependent oxidoreductase
VSKAFVDYISRSGNVTIVVASDKAEDAREAALAAGSSKFIALDALGNAQHLSSLIQDSDLVVSLLPAPLHPTVAKQCIRLQKHLVTASYESKEMRDMSQHAKDANIMILNEVGLDPGLDHMSAMKIIDDVRLRGGEVLGFSSVCGGLPHPNAATNPLRFKFSWSPKAVIRACQNPAQYRWEGTFKEVSGGELLKSAAPYTDHWNELELECLPNRDSLHYEKVYGIEGASTLFRGTLRYRGFSVLMNTFQNMGLFRESEAGVDSWGDLIEKLRATAHSVKLTDFIFTAAEHNSAEADRAMDCLHWLDVLAKEPVVKTRSVVDNFCDVLEEKLAYEHDEKDMVLMRHTIDASFADGKKERHQSSLQVFGTSAMSAMAKTVGYTTAACAELIIDGTLKGEKGLMLPINPMIYKPVLKRLELEGVLFDESEQ